MTENKPEINSSIEPPKYAGYWDVYPPNDIHHFRIFLVRRPSFFHRLMNKWLIGWEWNDT